MKIASIISAIVLLTTPAFGQTPPPLAPVDDVTQLANPANRTIQQDHRQKNLVPERTPSGMTVYREAPQKQQDAKPVVPLPVTAMPPVEAKQYQPDPQESPTARLAALFDIEKHCKHIGSMATGGSYTLERACRRQEREAFSELSSMKLPPEIEKHCAHIGSLSSGGSYTLMRACIKQEIEAKESLR